LPSLRQKHEKEFILYVSVVVSTEETVELGLARDNNSGWVDVGQELAINP